MQGQAMQPNEVRAALEELDVLELDATQVLDVCREVYRRTNGNGPYEYVSQFGKRHGIQGEDLFLVWSAGGDGPDVLDGLRAQARAEMVRELDAGEHDAEAGIEAALEVLGVTDRGRAQEMEPGPPAIEAVWAVTGKNTPPRPPFAIEGLCVKGESLQIVGPEKCGKSFEAIRLALTLATGGAYRGKRCEAGRVLYVNSEMLRSSFCNRCEDVRSAMGLEPEDYARTFDAITLLGSQIEGAPPTFESLFYYLSGAYDMRAYDYVFLDPIYKLEDGDENSSSDTRRWISTWDKMRATWGLTLVYVHHTGKGAGAGMSSYQAARGHSNFGGYAGSQITITPLVVRPDTDAWDALEALGIEEPGEGAAYRIRMGGRDAPRSRTVNAYRMHPLLVEDTAGILDGCPVWGDSEGARVQGVRAKNRREGAEHRNDAQSATARAVEACRADGNPATRRNVYDMYLAEACEAVGIQRPKRETFEKWTKNPAPGGRAQTTYRVNPETRELFDSNDGA